MSDIELQFGPETVRVTMPVLSAHADLTAHAPDIPPPTPLVRRQWASLQVSAAIRAGGHVFSLAQLDQLEASPQTLLALQAVRIDQLERVRDSGRCALDCPHCGAPQTFDLAGLWLSTGASPSPLRDAEGWPRAPSLAYGYRPGPAPVGRCATRAVLTLPASGLEAVLTKPADVSDEARALQVWESPAAGTGRRRANPGFRALLRMSVALDLLDGAPPELPQLEALPAPDALFIDACYEVLLTSTITADRPAFPCSACAEPFVTALPRP